MNRRTHLVIGFVLFLCWTRIAGSTHSVSGEVFVIGVIAAAAGSVYPDILEPATNARHRGFFHSRRMLVFATAGFLVTAVTILSTPGMPRLALVFGASSGFLGYSTHLLADSLTRAGLPG